MSRIFSDTDKFESESPSSVVTAINTAMQTVVRERFEASGQDWKNFVFGESLETIAAEDFRAVEEALLDAGHRYDWSAAISPQERPHAYKPALGTSEDELDTFCFADPEAPVGETDGEGLELRGVGDNVVSYSEDTVGIARYVRSTGRVLTWLGEGVPEDTIAVIDDSGGTLTAPILEQFKGVICAGGTVRSHLGILTREYGIPCLMNSRVNGIMEGDTVRMESTARAKNTADYQSGREVTANIWRVHTR